MLDTKMLLGALDELENKGISREITIQSLKEAFQAIFKKKDFVDERIQVDILPEDGQINIYSIKKVVEEVNDDALEIELEDALEINKDAKVGDDLYKKIELDSLTKQDAFKFKAILKQKIKEAEKAAIVDAYSDKQGELISGVVEKITDNSTFINIGRVTVALNNRHKIGDETFTVGQTIKVHLSEVSSAVGGPQLQVSRADSGFLRRLFEAEIPEIYDGVVEIKDIAREAGERSKVSVLSKDKDVDPIGACIGQAGTKIQRICQQIGREKIDIVQYHELPGLFIAEALKPATVLGVVINKDSKSAIAVVKDGDLRVAIGKKGINVLLAVRLTGWKIDIKELTTALEEHIVYTSLEELTKQEEEIILERKRDEIVKKAQTETLNANLPETEEIVEEQNYEEEPLVEQEEQVEVMQEEEKVEVEEAPAKPEVKFEDEKVELKPVFMQAKVSLNELEKQIDEEKKKNRNQPKPKKYKKEEYEEPKKEEVVEKVDRNNYMEVEYTEEELEEIENQEAADAPTYDDDIDYDEYDKYYED
ncbi:MAG: transcription termination factor NusA [Bacilli bacterium]